MRDCAASIRAIIRRVLHFKSRDFVVDSPMRRNEVTDIDGQPGPRFPVRITCEAGALRVIRPAHHRKD
ncbi:MAG: hypothetical protein ACLR8Y_07775 [Alistipes indistinctus]